ncbi:DUF5330 domain-containing protein [Aureimonas psammosilenae]|uniref:DUF5330 domain-containing protein n=1 Tax=Aureimonas psammosilenae TaxID=2495496 RepID=UPI0012604253|nr:DUF5330 domain-containing protein [Aureimonas psammosilenae]
MIRFAIKCALGLGLLAMVLPLAEPSQEPKADIDLFGLAVGMQEAVSDLGSFCERAPAACSAAHEVAVFAGERIETGFRIGADYLGAYLASEPQTVATGETVPPRGETRHGPVLAIREMLAGPALPQPYQPPKRVASETAADEPPSAEAAPVAIPVPRPRG